MSRRYGRNQKRHHREEIARLNQAYAMAVGLSKRLATDLRDAKGTIAEMLTIIDAVCSHSVAIPAKQLRGQGPRDRCQVEDLPPIGFSEVIGGEYAPSAVSFRLIDLYALRVFLESRRDTFSAAVHLDYAAGPHSAYMISEEGLRSLPREMLMHRLVPDIGRAFATGNQMDKREELTEAVRVVRGISESYMRCRKDPESLVVGTDTLQLRVKHLTILVETLDMLNAGSCGH